MQQYAKDNPQKVQQVQKQVTEVQKKNKFKDRKIKHR
jgi:hypothetical protein